ncbi:MAG: class I SAM-dependent rRNA methyltransferase [Acidobacteria bacterium]|nr:class I SAM-dependent rRNA methyltransferase [Acidobacteriota bacterium]
METVQLKPKRAQVFLAYGHPWIFSQGLVQRPKLQPGELVRVLYANNACLGFGFYHPENAIALRMVQTGDQLASDWLEQALSRALMLRTQFPLGFSRSGFRWVHGENDGLPGLTVDHYGSFLSVHILSAGMDRLRDRLVQALGDLCGNLPIFESSSGPVRKQEGLADRVGFLSGSCTFPVDYKEAGLVFSLDPSDQKTGFFLDQAPNRVALASCVQGKTVLDLCCFSGGFSLSAARAGAQKVTAVDVSAKALARLNANAEKNQISGIETIQSDMFEFLKGETQAYDWVICDPPAMARAVKDREPALKAYRKLNRLVAPWVKPGGRLWTFSCSGTIEDQAFFQSVFLGLRDARRTARRLAVMGPGPDHPVALHFPEGAYLKGLDLVLD